MESSTWVERYRPRNFEDFKGQIEIIKRIRAFVEHKNVPNMLFAGPAGVGKTSVSLIIAKELYGENWRENFLELNASDDRGIDVVRNTIKDFARTKSIGDAPFKIILLDESDSLTRDAQQALRRTMEQYSNSCRFILSANYSSRILGPIQSRCSVFRFKPLNKEEIREIITNIAKHEKLRVDEKAVDALFELCGGDVRRLGNILQSCASVEKHITSELIYKVASYADPKEVKDILNLAVKGEFIKSRDLLLNVMLRDGLSGIDMIKQIQKEIWNLQVDDVKKLFMTEKCGDIEFRMVEGSDEFLQMEALIASFCKK
ncbi:replication factor C small subunit [Candidatus Woesearchaeota archaeon]|nr:replication factor C small subunit [Candidatus Woesearchaeota archaeon]